VFKSSTAAVRAINLNTNGGTLAVATVGQTYGHSAAATPFSVAAAPAAGGFNPISPTGPFPNQFSGSSMVENFSRMVPAEYFTTRTAPPLRRKMCCSLETVAWSAIT